MFAINHTVVPVRNVFDNIDRIVNFFDSFSIIEKKTKQSLVFFWQLLLEKFLKTSFKGMTVVD